MVSAVHSETILNNWPLAAVTVARRVAESVRIRKSSMVRDANRAKMMAETLPPQRTFERLHERSCHRLWGYAFLLWLMMSTASYSQPTSDSQSTWVIALHGGAGALPRSLPPEVVARYRNSLDRALQCGIDVLSKGGKSLDAVTATVVALENDPMFNAGRGAVFNARGFHELDASIMDGQTLEGGGVAGLQRIRNPILAARLVMDDSHHVLISGEEADAFAENGGCATVEQSYYYTEKRWQQLQRALPLMKLDPLSSPAYPIPTDLGPDNNPEGDTGETVGCVALDVHGNLAAATSTGGRTAKRFGRIGDSPILGAGTYADNNTAAISGTGIGEEYIRHSIAARVSLRMELANNTLEEACKNCLEQVLRPNDGGLIAVDYEGNLFLGTNTPTMSRAWAHSDGRRECAIWDEPLLPKSN